MRAHLATRLLLTTLTAAGATGASAQTVSYDPGTTHHATALTGFATTGSGMGGMKVTAFFTDGSQSTQTWGDLGGGMWGVQNAAYAVLLGAAADSYTEPWRLLDNSGLGISRVVFNGAPGGTVFDVIPDPWLTDGSAQGRAVSVVPTDFPVTAAWYRNLVGIGAAAPLLDLYETLDMSFKYPVGPNGVQFIADTDNIGIRGTITSAPEPATFGLIAFGAAAIVAADWRRRRAVVRA